VKNGSNGNGKPKRGRGRPSGTTRVESDPEFRERLLAALAEYESKSAACAIVGCHYQSLRNWIEKAWHATEGFWANFFVAYTRARAPFWEAATKLLSKRDPSIILANECPDEWNVRKHVDLTIHEDPFDILSDPEVAHALDRAFARGAESRSLAESSSARN